MVGQLRPSKSTVSSNNTLCPSSDLCIGCVYEMYINVVHQLRTSTLDINSVNQLQLCKSSRNWAINSVSQFALGKSSLYINFVHQFDLLELLSCSRACWLFVRFSRFVCCLFDIFFDLLLVSNKMTFFHLCLQGSQPRSLALKRFPTRVYDQRYGNLCYGGRGAIQKGSFAWRAAP